MAKDKSELDKLDEIDQGINTNEKKIEPSVLGWHDVDRKDLPYEGMFFPTAYKFQVQAASAATIAHYSSMDESNPLSVQAALTHVIKEHIRIYNGKSKVDPLKVIHESMRFWFAMLVHTYTGNASALEATENCPSPNCNHVNKITITPYVIEFQEAGDYVTDRTDAVTGEIVQETKSYGKLVYQPITLSMRAELLSYMQEKHQLKQNFDMQFLSYAPLIWPQREAGQSIDDLYNKVYYPMTQDVKKFSVYTTIIRKIAIDQLLNIATDCSKCGTAFRLDISRATGLRDIFLAADTDSELL